MDCTGVYDTDGNLTNVTISAEKQAEILSFDFTGSGTSTDPYQVNSSLGFWFMSKFVTLTNCYVELNCDIILNDETFDENGNASGGDGVVYSWNGFAGYNSGFNINGKNNTIHGLYCNDVNLDCFSLFGKAVLNEIKNLSLNDVYININKEAYPFFNNAVVATNLTTISGQINAVKNACGIGGTAKSITNCQNYANLFVSDSNIAGIVNEVNTSINNCVNYGNITLIRAEKKGTWSSIGGICVATLSYAKIDNCKNYGNIKEINGGLILGGIASRAGRITISNCENYGEIYVENSYGYNGGIVGFGISELKILNCDNYGNIKTISGPSIGGIFGQSDNSKDIVIDGCNNYGYMYATISERVCPIAVYASCGIIIKNCGIYGTYEGNFVAYFMETCHKSEDSEDSNAIISNCEIDCKNMASHSVVVMRANRDVIIDKLTIKTEEEIDTQFAFVWNKYGTSSFDINVKISNVFFNTFINGKYNFMFIQSMDGFDFEIKNCYIKTIGSGTFNYVSPVKYEESKLKVDGIVIDSDSRKIYFGSNFSGFYVSWRTGKIGLKALDGVGYFQGAIDEEWLANNGFVKKN